MWRMDGPMWPWCMRMVRSSLMRELRASFGTVTLCTTTQNGASIAVLIQYLIQWTQLNFKMFNFGWRNKHFLHKVIINSNLVLVLINWELVSSRVGFKEKPSVFKSMRMPNLKGTMSWDCCLFFHNSYSSEPLLHMLKYFQGLNFAEMLAYAKKVSSDIATMESSHIVSLIPWSQAQQYY